jgi:hypothetical protein
MEISFSAVSLKLSFKRSSAVLKDCCMHTFIQRWSSCSFSLLELCSIHKKQFVVVTSVSFLGAYLQNDLVDKM